MPLQDRVDWVTDNEEMLLDVAPTGVTTTTYWSTADKPFSFLAACMELLAAIAALRSLRQPQLSIWLAGID